VGVGILSWIAFFVWASSEIVIVIRTKLLRHNALTTKVDKGSYWLIIIGIYLGIGIAFLFHSQNWGWVSQPVANIGAVLMLIGVALRLWSNQVLGRYFSTVVSVESNQMLIKSGPYKLIRHPAYTGSLLTFVSFGIALNSWIASCIILFMLSTSFIYRIHIEEKALISHFHSAYEEYSRSTWRLIPYIW
jgi:protein-S-isoprenylcysteine O-methyltransferase Ste14